jgi:hypothetical protein
VQVPLLPERLHALHCSVQGVLQQTPSAQYPVTHSVPLAQAPLVFFGTQLVPSQYEPVAQGVPEQLGAQPLPSVVHRLLAHGPTFAAGQFPAPSQDDDCVSVPLVQLACEQTVELLGKVQAMTLFPSHCPLQGAVPPHARRWPCGSPWTAMHFPTLFFSLHD